MKKLKVCDAGLCIADTLLLYNMLITSKSEILLNMYSQCHKKEEKDNPPPLYLQILYNKIVTSVNSTQNNNNLFTI